MHHTLPTGAYLLEVEGHLPENIDYAFTKIVIVKWAEISPNAWCILYNDNLV